MPELSGHDISVAFRGVLRTCGTAYVDAGAIASRTEAFGRDLTTGGDCSTFLAMSCRLAKLTTMKKAPLSGLSVVARRA
jgi:hypothetical protein